MAVATPALEREQPRLVFFHSALSGHCRRVEGFLAQVLQRRRNHGTFEVVRVSEEDRPDLLQHFKIDTVPTLVVHGDADRILPLAACSSSQVFTDSRSACASDRS